MPDGARARAPDAPEADVSVSLTPYLNFAGTAREAMAFYASVFGGTPDVMTFGSMGMEGVDPDWVMHSFLRGDNGFELMGSDMPPSMGTPTPGNVTLSLSGTDEQQLTAWWNALSEGGTIGMPLSPAPWGASYGDFTDRFGIRWLVNIGG